MDAKSLMEKQLEILEQEKRDLALKAKQLAKRLDHTERAYRRHEHPQWEADYVEQKKTEKAYYTALKNLQLEKAATEHAEGLKVKARIQRMMGDYNEYRAQLESVRNADYEAKKAKAQALIEEAKAARIAEVKKKREEEKKRRKQEEEERAQLAEEERIADEGNQ
jgi:translation initiation factor 3 subunit A